MLKKKFLFTLLLFSGLYYIIEGGAYLAFHAVTKEKYNFRAIAIEQSEMMHAKRNDADTEGVINATPYEALHPYLGYVLGEDERIIVPRTEEGFIDTSSVIAHRKKDEVIIGILGGSLASMFYLSARESLPDRLQKSPLFKGKKIRLVDLALGGYKEPQQLFSFLWVLSLGGEFDYILNIDGLNDIALAPMENLPAGVSPYYPRNWHKRLEGIPDHAEKVLMGKIALLDEERSRWAEKMSLPVTSIFLDLIWKWKDNAMKNKRNILQHQLATYRKKTPLSYAERGMAYHSGNNEKLLGDLSRFWKACSLLIAENCKERGIRYLHLLQPNQYVPHSKVIQEEKKAGAFSETSPYKPLVEKGYPFLQGFGKELQKEGVAFIDETMLFQNEKRRLYRDSCCHLNRLGNMLLEKEVARLLSLKEVKKVK